MRNKLVKIVTISSLILIVGLFSSITFSGFNSDNKLVFYAENNNFKKMDNNTLLRFDDAFKVKENFEKMSINVVEDLSDEKDKDDSPVLEKDLDVEVIEETKEKISDTEEKKEEVVNTSTEVNSNSNNGNSNVTSLEEEREVLQTVTGTLTGYGADCYGCSGTTSSGFNLTESIYYNDSEFGTVRILAADPSFPFYSIIRISNIPGMDSFIGIVLDRGSNVGFGRGTLFDLAFSSEGDPNLIPLTRNVTFEVLRSGK